MRTILLMGGSMGYADHVKILEKLTGIGLPLQLLVVCGNNTKKMCIRDRHQIDHLARNRRQVNLEVTRVQDRTERRGDRQCNRIRDRVVGVDKLDLKAAQLDLSLLHI